MPSRLLAVLALALSAACSAPPPAETSPARPGPLPTPGDAALAAADEAPPDAAAEACVPRDRREVCGAGVGSPCGAVNAGCPGATVACGCSRGLTCEAGFCAPPLPTCDPVGPRQVCRDGVCGRLSAGCPGVFVECPCPAGQTCRDGQCRR
jgi:hypothetical protein